MAKLSKKIIASTQEHLDIEDVKEDILILKDGRTCVIIETSAVNFTLLSEVEQESKIAAFAGLLNSINFNLQIVVHTENVDVSKYIITLEKYYEKQKNDKIKYQIRNYIEFIKNLIKRNDVLDKRFFIVIPYVPYGVKKTSPLAQIFKKPDKIYDMDKLVEKSKVDLYPKRDSVMKLLLRLGIRSRQLSGEEIVKLFYKLYNTELGYIPKVHFSEEDYEYGMIGYTRKAKQVDQSKIFKENGPDING